MTTQDAIDYFGSGAKLAEALGITRHAVYQWGEFVPELRARQIQDITRGRLKWRGERPKARAVRAAR